MIKLLCILALGGLVAIARRRRFRDEGDLVARYERAHLARTIRQQGSLERHRHMAGLSIL